MKIRKQSKTKHINFYVSEGLRKKIDEIKKDYFLTDVLKNLLEKFHKDNYGK